MEILRTHIMTVVINNVKQVLGNVISIIIYKG